MDRAVFYKAIKNTSAFGKSLSGPQVIGMEALLNAFEGKVVNPHYAANMLAETHHETAGYMYPIKETVMPTHKDKDPDDDTVKARLTKAWKSGKLPWVKKDYWTSGYFGRGMVQITHEANYKKVGDAIGVDLVAKPQLALDPATSAQIVVIGMVNGLFTGKRLADYKFPADLSAASDKNPRRIINGKDGTDAEVAKTHKVFYDALVAAKFAV